MNAGRLLARLTAAPALLVVAWLAVSLPLLMIGAFSLGPVLVLFVPVAVLVLRALPRRLGDEPVSWWSTGGVIAVALGFLALELAMVSQQIIVRRDPASYVQYALWLADHGSLPIPQDHAAFGGDDPALRFNSPAFYQVGTAVVPQFMPGLPLVLALGSWVGGPYALLAMGPLLGACGVLAFGGLTARLVGPRWAPLGALALALTLPMQWLARSTYSEAVAMVLLFGGLALVHDAGRAGRRDGRVQAFLGGLTLGLIVLVRIDGIRDVLPVVVFAGLLLGLRRTLGPPLAAGLVLGAGTGIGAGYALSRPYLDHLSGSLHPLLLLAAVVVAGTAVLTAVLRTGFGRHAFGELGDRVAGGRLPDLAAMGTVLVMIGFALRPFLETVRRVPHSPDDRLNAEFIEYLQGLTGLPVDGTRQYSEDSLYWLAWYVGVPGLLAATFGAALLGRRLLRGRSTEWALPFAVFGWTTVTTLLRPGITPDHPWASRRLLSIVIPGMLLFAIWATAWALPRLRRLGAGRRPGGRPRLAAGLAVLLLLVPIAVSSALLTFARTEQGEVAAVRGLCREIGPGRSVVIVERVTADRFLQVVRSMCGLPAARADGASRGDVRRVIAAVHRAGRRPALLGAEAADVAPYGPPHRAIRLRTRQDEKTLVTPPNATWSLSIDVWLTHPADR
ncbi:hypothetical protein DPM19_14715 [Actinomadura craniellae]|uniref:Glycosyltransferase RgtA/B/C/D-like domain-containing protein n=2 Tax=Actinomadura craniellae TaxID=2231787 RepID=A0A365H637_9ACTN|nr:hypothetical protein DPM19_14715 [Actinomadura craniellae]